MLVLVLVLVRWCWWLLVVGWSIQIHSLLPSFVHSFV